MRRVNVRVQPRASRSEIVSEEPDGSLRLRVTAAPADGEANKAVISLMARRFGVPKSSIAIVAGAASRNKVVEILE